jgi:thiamine biosynthesis lipoprotein
MSTRTYSLRPRAGRRENRLAFDCFGGRCTVIVADAMRPSAAAEAAHAARQALLTWHGRFSRFRPDSEISRLNRNPSSRVAVSPLLARMIEVGRQAGHDTGGVVDVTLGGEIERAGYAEHRDPVAPDPAALTFAPPRAGAGPHPDERWRQISLNRAAGTVTRPPGLAIDIGGVAKGVFADELGAMLEEFETYAIDCAGDIRIGGRAGIPRPVEVPHPLDGSLLRRLQVARGGVATSGIARRRWTADGGRPAHHLLDPATGRPAFTGVLQATALAPSAAQAEVLAKAALLSGPARAREWLPYAGLVVLEDGTVV